MNRRILVVDDEPGILDGYRAILSPTVAAGPRVVSSRAKGSAATAAQPVATPNAFEVSYASNGEEALNLIKKGISEGNPYVGGFFDVKLGRGIDGIETIRQAKAFDSQLLVVLVTAYQDRSIDEIAKIFGEEFSDHWDLLSKPFTHNEILQKAKHLISDWNRRRREIEHLRKIEDQQNQLVQSERVAAVGTLARSVGHEFGNILLRIIGKADLAVEKKDPTEMEEALRVIASSAERAGVIVRNLQSLVQIQVKRETVSLKVPLDESLSLISHELKKNSIELVNQIPENLPEIQMNRIEIGQVLLNLMINAMHAMEPKGGKLILSSEVTPTEVVLHVKDTGCGVPPEVMDKIFEPLFTTKGAKGSGLGLSVSKKIIENHQGQIKVTSEVGKGTTFTLHFPNGKGKA